jgi:hypothetical protein
MTFTLCQNLTKRSYLFTSHMLPKCKFEASALVARFYNALSRGSQKMQEGAMSLVIFACLLNRLSVRVFVCM